MTVFFTADTHFGHGNVVRLSKRPFADVSVMNEALVAAWNDVVGADDVVWHLGDFAYGEGEWLDGLWWRLNGSKHLIIGNHDKENIGVLTLPWANAPTYMAETSVDGVGIVMCHYPLRSWQGVGKGAIHLFGHMHGRLAGNRQSCDVGVDAWEFRPVTLDQIATRLKSQPHYPEKVLDLDIDP
jgi:calcineurin-like phosphoesterase family protein